MSRYATATQYPHRARPTGVPGRLPTYRRLLVALLGGQLLVGVLFGVLTLALYRGSGVSSLDDAVPVRVLLPIHIATAVVLIVVTAGIAIATLHVLTRRLRALILLVGEQMRASGLPALPRAGQQDVFDSLTAQLQRLFDAYRANVDALSRRADTLATLNTIAQTANSTFDLQQVFDTSLREVLENIGWDMGGIYLWDERRSTLDLVSLHGMSESIVRRRLSYPLGEGTVGAAAVRREMVQASGDDPACEVALPLVTVPGTLLGVLCLASRRPATLDDHDLNLLATVAEQIALAVDKSRLYLAVSAHAGDLERQVAERTAELATAIEDLSIALERAKEADKLKSMLLSTVSHELRTPLATIKGNTSLLLEHHARITPDLLVEHLHDIEEETDKLTDLISNLLEMSRIEAGMLHVQRESICLQDVLESAVAAARVRRPGHPIRLEVPPHLPSVLGDPRRIEQIVANLLDNAAKYSPPGSLIEVTAALRTDSIAVSVKDHGQGIAPEQLERVFDRFYQVESGSPGGRRGIGLGLAICRGLVEAHEGDIWAESTPGVGSTFSFTLPLAGQYISVERDNRE